MATTVRVNPSCRVAPQISSDTHKTSIAQRSSVVSFGLLGTTCSTFSSGGKLSLSGGGATTRSLLMFGRPRSQRLLSTNNKAASSRPTARFLTTKSWRRTTTLAANSPPAPLLARGPWSFSVSSSGFLLPLNNRINNTSYGLRFYCTGGGDVVVQVQPMGDSITDGKIQKWHKNVGEHVGADEVVASIETDKLVVEIRAPQSGTITQLFAQAGETVKVGADLFKLSKSSSVAKSEQPKQQSTPPPPAKAVSVSAPTPAPISTPTPTPTPTPAAPVTPKPTPAAKPTSVSTSSVPSGQRTERRVPLSRMRLRIADRLKGSQNTYAMLTTFNEIDMSNIISMRNQFKDEFLEKHGVKLGFMSGFVRAATVALQEQPVVNAVIDGEEVVYRDYIDISVAVATPTGLVVPVLRDCNRLSFADIEKSIYNLGLKARDNKLLVEDMEGGTFTISNGGVYGSMMGTPIINPPQSAILGMHATKDRAVVVDGKVEVRPVMYVALTYDHRLIDGRDAVTFLVKIKKLIEDPRRLLLDL